MSTLRSKVVMAPPVRSARDLAGRTLAPALRGRIAAGSHAERLRWVRRLVPGSLGQVPEEICGFAELAAAREPVRLCEIGTMFAGTSLFFCGIAPSLRTYVGLDVELINDRLVSSLAPAHVDVRFLRGSSYDPTTRSRVEEILGGEPLDVLFIDGDHRYEGVRADLELYRDLVRPGGLIAFHDIVLDHGQRFGRPTPFSAGGVPQLWSEVKDAFRTWEFVADPDQDGFGIGVLEQDPAVELPGRREEGSVAST